MPNFMRGSFKTRSQVKLWGHLVALALAIAVTSVAVARMLITNSQRKAAAQNTVTGNGGRRSMSGQIALSMAAKSIFFILYQLTAEHTSYFKERPKVNMILNCIEAVAWPAVVAFTVQGIIKKCTGTTCTLSWIIVPLAVIMSIVSALAAFISIGDWQYFKRTGVKPSDLVETSEVKLESAPVTMADSRESRHKVSRPQEARTRDSSSRGYSSRHHGSSHHGSSHHGSSHHGSSHHGSGYHSSRDHSSRHHSSRDYTSREYRPRDHRDNRPYA